MTIFNLKNNKSYYEVPKSTCNFTNVSNTSKNVSIFNNYTKNNNYATYNTFNTTNNFVSIKNSYTVNNYYNTQQSGVKTLQPGFKQNIGDYFKGFRANQPQQHGCGCKNNVQKQQPIFSNLANQCKSAFSGLFEMYNSYVSFRFK